MTSNALPLAGVRVIEIANMVSGPLVGLFLANFGADVIKVERLGVGDDARLMPPNLGGDGALFVLCGNNKRSVAVDLKHPRGQAVVSDLVAVSDVVLDNLRPGALARLGLDYATLSERDPRIITCSVTGFGIGNPYTGRAGLDPILQAMSGLTTVTGSDGDPPVLVGSPVIDFMSAVLGALGVTLAIRARDVTGQGQDVMTSLLGAAALLMAPRIFGYWANGIDRDRPPRGQFSDSPLIQLVATADGRNLTFALSSYPIFERLVRAGDSAHLLDDERFATIVDLALHGDEVRAALSEMFRAHSYDDWAKRLDDAGIPWGPVNSVVEFFDDPVVREMFLSSAIRTSGTTVPALAAPVFLSDAPPSAPAGPPALGEHTDEVLGALLGYSADRIAELRHDEIVA